MILHEAWARVPEENSLDFWPKFCKSRAWPSTAFWNVACVLDLESQINPFTPKFVLRGRVWVMKIFGKTLEVRKLNSAKIIKKEKTCFLGILELEIRILGIDLEIGKIRILKWSNFLKGKKCGGKGDLFSFMRRWVIIISFFEEAAGRKENNVPPAFYSKNSRRIKRLSNLGRNVRDLFGRNRPSASPRAESPPSKVTNIIFSLGW